jgi:hypothetical protein
MTKLYTFLCLLLVITTTTAAAAASTATAATTVAQIDGQIASSLFYLQRLFLFCSCLK